MARTFRVGVLTLTWLLLSACQTAPSPVPTPSGPTPSASPTTGSAQEQLDEQLRRAAWANDVDAARRLIDQGADVNAQDNTQQSAYLVATSEGYADLLDLTLAHGAAVNDKDSWNGTGLIRAAERGHWLVVGKLLAAGIDRDHVNRIGYQAIHEAIWLGRDTPDYVATVRALAAGGVELTRPSGDEGLTPRAMAEQRNHPAQLAALSTILDAPAPADPDAALLAAAGSGDADAAAVALRAGANLEARDAQGRTPLLVAAAGDHVDVARVLVALGADPDAVDQRSDTPWLVTGVTGSVPMGETLLLAHPDVTLRNRFGGVSIIPAAERGHADYVRWATTHTEIDVDHVNDLGWTALLEAVILGDGGPDHVEVVRALLDAGADRSIADRDGVTALQHAQRRGQVEVEDLLS